MTGPTSWKNRITFAGDPVMDTDSWSPSTSRTVAELGILEDLLAFLVQ